MNSQEDGSLADLHAIISEGRRSLFIKKIFRKDEAYYNTIIQSLNEAATWKEASQNLNTLFLENNIDPFTAIVVEFTDTIHSRYLPTSPP